MPMEILGCINSVAETRLALRLASSVSVCRPRLGSDKLAVFEVVMLVVMQAHATEEQVRAVCQKIESLGYRAHPIPGAQRTAIGITGNRGEVEAGTLLCRFHEGARRQVRNGLSLVAKRSPLVGSWKESRTPLLCTA